MNKQILLVALLLNLFIATLSAQQENYVIARSPFSTPKYDEFSPVYYREGIVFSSNKPQSMFPGYTTSDNKPLFKIFRADTTGSQVQESVPLPGDINSNLNNGPATFNRTMDTIYFSRNLIVEGTAREISSRTNKLGLFFAVLKNGEWTEVSEMRFNDYAWNVTTPYLSPDGRRLYFASDKPEGYGGSDLYFSEWKNGYWNNPVNLGSVVNTGGNEAYPFVNDAGDLFFSSDSLPGKGKKDIFYTRYADTSWIEPVNLNSPVNSAGNDFGFVSDGMISKGFFSSDRYGSVDIYSFKTLYPQFFYCETEQNGNFCYTFSDDAMMDIDPIALQFRWDFGDGKVSNGYVADHCFPGAGEYTVKQSVADKKTGKIVFEKSVYKLIISERSLPKIVADQPVTPGKEVNLSAGLSLPGYEVISYFWNINDEPRGRNSSLKYAFGEGETPVKMLAYLRESTTGISKQVCVEKIFRQSEAVAVSGSPAESGQGAPLDMTGSVTRNGAFLEKVYSASDELSKKAVFAVQIHESIKPLPVSDGVFRIDPKYRVKMIKSGKGYAYIIDEQTEFRSAYPAYVDAVEEGFRDARIRMYDPVDNGEIELWNFKRTYGTSTEIFFDNNGTVISQKGTPILDRLILLMKRNPDLKIQVAAHTENSGSAYTNQQLSLKQAQNIVDYLVLNGISRSRLSSAGYGGSRPVAPEYPESERLRNRRIDFIKTN